MNLQDQMGIDERINEAFQPISSFWEALILHEFFDGNFNQKQF